MKKKRIQYNELNEEIYSPKYWTQTRLVATGICLLFLGFFLNFSLEEKMNKWLQATLSSNANCPIQFEKAELNYFFPKINISKVIVQGVCFGQYNNRLNIRSVKIGFKGPSFYPLGIKLQITAEEFKSKLNIIASISPFFQYIDFENTIIDAQILGVMTSTNKSLIAGILKIDGFIKLESNEISDGQLKIKSNNFHLPPQNISGFEMPMVNLNNLNIETHFESKTLMQVEHFDIGQSNAPLNIKMKGKIHVNESSFMNSLLDVSGPMNLTAYILQNFAIIKLFLPENNTSGNYQLRLSGPLSNLNKPEIK